MPRISEFPPKYAPSPSAFVAGVDVNENGEKINVQIPFSAFGEYKSYFYQAEYEGVNMLMLIKALETQGYNCDGTKQPMILTLSGAFGNRIFMGYITSYADGNSCQFELFDLANSIKYSQLETTSSLVSISNALNNAHPAKYVSGGIKYVTLSDADYTNISFADIATAIETEGGSMLGVNFVKIVEGDINGNYLLNCEVYTGNTVSAYLLDLGTLTQYSTSGATSPTNTLKDLIINRTYGSVTEVGSGYLTEESLEGYASESYVDEKVAGVVNSAPATLDTLNELSKALGDDPNFATTVATQIGNKVDKETGKGLSANDYTTAEKNKLAGIAEGANNYTHPDSHPADMITGLATVAKSGSYNDLADTPTIPSIDGLASESYVDTKIAEEGGYPYVRLYSDAPNVTLLKALVDVVNTDNANRTLVEIYGYSTALLSVKAYAYDDGTCRIWATNLYNLRQSEALDVDPSAIYLNDFLYGDEYVVDNGSSGTDLPIYVISATTLPEFATEVIGKGYVENTTALAYINQRVYAFTIGLPFGAGSRHYTFLDVMTLKNYFKGAVSSDIALAQVLSGDATVTSVFDSITAHETRIAELEDNDYLTEESLEGYAKTTDLFSKSYNDLTDKPTIPSITSITDEEIDEICGVTLDTYLESIASEEVSF